MRRIAWLCVLFTGLGCMPTATPGRHAPRLGRGDTGLLVRLDEAARPDCEREILGVVDVSADRGDVIERLRAGARALGGDRVVDLEYHLGGPHEMPRLSGLAARCSKLLAGRDYVVIQRISVSARPGEHHAAFAEIAARARSMQAQLLVDVDYEQADGDGAMRITGKAARYVPQWWGLSTDHRLPGDPGGTLPPTRKRRAPAPRPVDCPDPSDGNQLPPLDRCRLQF